MARTTKSNITQRTVGPVPTAVEPTDPVPLSQGGGFDTIWGAAQGSQAAVPESRQWDWLWNSEIVTGGAPYTVPFLMRLKEVDWRVIGHTPVTLNVFRNYQLVATVGSGTHSNLNLLFQPNQVGFFRTSSFVRLQFSWQLLTRWEIVSRSVDTAAVPDVLPVTALTTGRGPTAGIMSRLQTQENQDVPEIAASPKKGFAAWIKRRFR